MGHGHRVELGGHRAGPGGLALAAGVAALALTGAASAEANPPRYSYDVPVLAGLTVATDAPRLAQHRLEPDPRPLPR